MPRLLQWLCLHDALTDACSGRVVWYKSRLRTFWHRKRAMPLASPKYPFTDWAVAGAPEERGLYALYRNDAIICMGVAMGRGPDDTIRARLLAHMVANANPGEATHYKWEITSNPLTKREQYLAALGQQVPRCEDNMLGEG